MYCKYCGQEVFDDAVVCIHCGRSLVDTPTVKKTSEENGIIALLLCIFFGYLGAHRFYTGHIAIGIIQLFTLGGCVIWALIDFIMILTGSFTDSEGKKLVL